MPAQPNILWICTDQQRFDTIRSLGNAHIRTPNLDRLVAEGVAFDRAYCQTPICTPSRASFLTGMYPSTLHACTNGNERWAEAAPLVTKLLADAGYDCGLAGKLHLAGAQGRIEPRPEDDGYRVFHWSHHPYDDWEAGHDYADWVRSQGADPQALYAENGCFPTELHQTVWCTDRALDFMREKRDAPWLFSVNYFDPHSAFDPPQEYLERYDPENMPGPFFRESDFETQRKLADVDFQTDCRRPEEFDAKQVQAAYYAMIELIDENVGRLLAYLDENGERDNTIVIFTSDHGECLGDHGLLLKGCRFYEGLVRVPLIFSCPDRFLKGVVSDALVELTDIVPTLLEECAVPGHARIIGRSLAPMLRGKSDPHRHRDHVRCEYYRTLNADAPGRTFSNSYGTMIRDERCKLIVYHEQDYGELYDLDNDPCEFVNLWDDPAFQDRKFRLMKRSFDDLAHAVDIGPRQVAYY